MLYLYTVYYNRIAEVKKHYTPVKKPYFPHRVTMVVKKKTVKVEAVDLEEEKLQMLLGNWKLHLLKSISFAGVF